MFYRLWGAAIRHPKRALWTATIILAIGSMAHLVASSRLFMRAAGIGMLQQSDQSITPAALASRTAQAQFNLNAALIAAIREKSWTGRLLHAVRSAAPEITFRSVIHIDCSLQTKATCPSLTSCVSFE